MVDLRGELIDFASEAVMLGLGTLLPHISVNMLEFPAISTQFFELLELVVTSYPERFAKLDDSTRDNMWKAVAFSFDSPNNKLVRAGLTVLDSVTKHHIKSNGETAFGPRVVGFQRKLMEMLLLENTASSILEPIADALLVVIVANQQSFKSICDGFISQQTNPEILQRLCECFQNLLSLHLKIDRQTRAKFRQCVAKFVSNVRGLIQCK